MSCEQRATMTGKFCSFFQEILERSSPLIIPIATQWKNLAVHRSVVFASNEILSEAKSSFQVVVDDLVCCGSIFLQLRFARNDSSFVKSGFIPLLFLFGPDLLVHEGRLQSSLGSVANISPKSIS